VVAACKHAFRYLWPMQRKMRYLVFGVLGILAIGCSTDVDVNAPYDSRTVVFGLLDPRLDTQFVRINKTWLGDGNNFDIAQIRDSSEYPAGFVQGRMEALSGGNVVASYPINEIELDTKDEDGIFFAPEHRAYYFITPGGLETSRSYRLVLDLPDREVEAQTDVINVPLGAISTPPAGNPTFKINWASVNLNNQTTFFNPTFRWTTAANARRYEGTLLIYVTEKVYTNSSQTTLVEERLRVIEWNLGRLTTNNLAGGATVNLEANGEAFYNFLAARFPVDPNVKREMGVWDPVLQHSKCFDFVLAIANEDFNVFLDVSEPVTNIVQERPSYTNVSNGLGIWASRTTDRVNGIGMSEGSIRALVTGPITANRNFCFSNPFNEFYCGD